MLALTAEIGDVAVRTDLNKSFILRVTGASTLANWQELLTPTDSVQSVDGMTGAVTIATATEGVKGKAQIATQAEVNAGTDDTKFVTAKKLWAWTKQATETLLGMMKVATQAQVNAGTDDATAVTPKKLRAGFAISLAGNGYIAFPTWLGGLIVQWGSVVVPVNSTAIGTLGIKFPTGAFQGVCSYDYPDAEVYPIVAISFPSASQVKIGVKAESGSSFNCRYIVLGY